VLWYSVECTLCRVVVSSDQITIIATIIATDAKNRRSGPNVVVGAFLLLVAGAYQWNFGCPTMRYLIEYRNGKAFKVPYGEIRVSILQSFGAKFCIGPFYLVIFRD
jgi:hypothetical protein